MFGQRFIGWFSEWNTCADCGLFETPSFAIVNDLTHNERRVCERCFMRLFDFSPKGNGKL